MATQRKATTRQLEAARATLLTVFETENLSGVERDDISRVRHKLADLLDERDSGFMWPGPADTEAPDAD
jgi:hypothetical protein